MLAKKLRFLQVEPYYPEKETFMQSFNRVVTSSILLAFFLLVGCNSGPATESNTAAQTEEPQTVMPTGNPDDPVSPMRWSSAFRQALGTIVNQYIGIRDALMIDDVQVAVQKVSYFSSFLYRIDMQEMNNHAQNYVVAQRDKLVKQCVQLVSTQELSVFRSYYDDLSKTMAEIVRTFGTGQTFCFHYCPEANGGSGGYWLDAEEATRNPYGMEGCGRVVEIYPAIDANSNTF